MMKYLILTVWLIGSLSTLISQTPQQNLDKYWKFRNSFREKFIKIGKQPGESQPCGALLPTACVNNITYNGNTGDMIWGDGIIRHGHYLILLASEYRLLKNNGKDEAALATLNELYYALYAVQRLDIGAEARQDAINGTNTHETMSSTLNGFYNRDDVGENFAYLNWHDERSKVHCGHSVSFRTNNFLTENVPPNLVTEYNSYQNVPSQDQMSSLLVGLSMVIRLVNDPTLMVQPEAGLPARNPKQFAFDLMYFIITRPAQNNWFLLDVHGWPVNNGSGDLVLVAPAITRIFERFSGGAPLPYTTAHRKTGGYKAIREVVTGFTSGDGPTDQTYDSLNIYQKAIWNEIFNNMSVCLPAQIGDFANSPFLEWKCRSL